jgi:hypothetical protein
MSNTATVYVELLDENVDVWRPVQAEHVGGDLCWLRTRNRRDPDAHRSADVSFFSNLLAPEERREHPLQNEGRNLSVRPSSEGESQSPTLLNPPRDAFPHSTSPECWRQGRPGARLGRFTVFSRSYSFQPVSLRSKALRERAGGPMRVGALFALLAAVCMMLGLMRWPSVHWELALAWGTAGNSERLVLAAVFDGLNRYLGNFVGEFLGELSFSVFFVLSGVGLLRCQRAPGWLGWWGMTTGALGLVGMWRNVTPAVDAIAAVNNYLLPAWMIGFGIWLIRASRTQRESVVPSAR